MFTGIIEEIGTVKSVNKQEQGAIISIGCSKVLEDLKLGDSVAINGACQTAVKIGKDFFNVDAAPETLKVTNLGDLQPGDRVNLERAMQANGRFGGHIVTGHIDNAGTFIKRVSQGLADIYHFSAPDEVAKYMVSKGSICVNGISLTIASLNENQFTISIIPHTAKETTLAYLQPGDRVNLEADILAKYIENFLRKSDNTGDRITLDYLKEHGFYE